MSAAAASEAVACPLCGHAVSPQERVAACARCPFRPTTCQAICCARCGYSWVESSRWAQRVTRWWRGCRRPRAPGPAPSDGPRVVPLAELALHEEGEVASIQSRRSAYLQRLSAFGVVPGRRLRLRQRRPALVVQVGETELALDPQAGRDIFVRRPAPQPEEVSHA